MMKQNLCSSFKNVGTLWGRKADIKPLRSTSTGASIHVPQPFLWMGGITAAHLKQPITRTLVLQNNGDSVWQSHVWVSPHADWLSLNDINKLVVPPNCILRLAITTQPNVLRSMASGEYKIPNALHFDQLSVSITVWMLLLWIS